jgi:ABC-type microcin C transport system duplicated ATPase subunit YejF
MKEGQDRRAGPVEQVFTSPSIPIRAMLLAAEPKGRAAPSPDAPVVIEADR